jgi:hypothetical protein
VEELLVLVERDEVRALAEEEVDVTTEAGGGELGAEGGVEILTKGVEVFGRERPGVAFGGEDWGALGVERAESVHDRGEVLGLGEMVEVVGVVAKIDEVVGWIGGIRPRHYEDWIFMGAFCGPFGEHLCSILDRKPLRSMIVYLHSKLAQMMVNMLIHQRRPFDRGERAKEEVGLFAAFGRTACDKTIHRFEQPVLLRQEVALITD